MKTIELDNKIIENGQIYRGFESKIYKKGDILYKIFDKETCNEEAIKNKVAKLELIKDLDINVTKPIDLVKKEDKIVGYTMKDYKEYRSLNSFDRNNKKKIENLKKVKEELEKLHDNGIIYGDLRLDNILEHDGSILFCDVDNVNIAGHDFDVTCYCQNKYIEKFGLDKNIDNYMLNVITITYLKRIMELYCVEYIKDHHLPFIIDNKENREIAENMIKMKKKEMDLFINNTKKRYL